ncbi:MAG: hypothetical protein QX197_14445 [Methylococcaceae bacterium]
MSIKARLDKLEQLTGVNEELPYFMKPDYVMSSDPIQASKEYLDFILYRPPGCKPEPCLAPISEIDAAEASRQYLKFIGCE